MPDLNPQHPIAVVGAGVAGLTAARTLAQAGCHVTLLEQADAVGGKLKTVRLGRARFDAGAQQVAARDPWMAALLEEAGNAGAARVWTRQLRDVAGNAVGPPVDRWCGADGMAALAAWIGDVPGVELRTNTCVESLQLDDGGTWRLATGDGEAGLVASAAILAVPPVATLPLLDPLSGPDAELAARLHRVVYQPTIALLLELDGPSGIDPAIGPGVVGDGQPFTFICDNQQRGISPNAAGLTLLASNDWSRAHIDAASDDTITAALLPAATPFVGTARVVSRQVVRWPSGIAPLPPPTEDDPPPFAWVWQHPPRLPDPPHPPLLLAGATLREDCVEAAALSGRAAALSLLEHTG